MPKLAIDTCIEIMNYLRQMGHELRSPGADIQKAIIIKAGGDNRTRVKYFSLLKEFELIRAVGDAAPGHFDLDFGMVAKYGRRK